MNLEEMIRRMKEERKENARNMTIGEMIYKLDHWSHSLDETITFSNGQYFSGDYGSYRGYYEDLYIGGSFIDKGLNTVGDLRDVLKKALQNGEMYGYKGGEYPINNDTLVWFATYGNTGEMIHDIQRLNDDLIVIIEKGED